MPRGGTWRYLHGHLCLLYPGHHSPAAPPLPLQQGAVVPTFSAALRCPVLTSEHSGATAGIRCAPGCSPLRPSMPVPSPLGPADLVLPLLLSVGGHGTSCSMARALLCLTCGLAQQALHAALAGSGSAARPCSVALEDAAPPGDEGLVLVLAGCWPQIAPFLCLVVTWASAACHLLHQSQHDRGQEASHSGHRGVDWGRLPRRGHSGHEDQGGSWG